jgi:hypothetical protein
VVTEPTTPAPDRHHIDAGDGTHLHPDRVAARYTIAEDVWTDVPEARPRARVRVSEGEGVATVTVDVDGGLHWHPSRDVVVDRYEGDGYAAVRAEGEARWAAIDERRATS